MIGGNVFLPKWCRICQAHDICIWSIVRQGRAGRAWRMFMLKKSVLFICCRPFWNRCLLCWVHKIAVETRGGRTDKRTREDRATQPLVSWKTSQRLLGAVPDVGKRWPWWQQCCICDYAVDWPGWFVAPWLWYCISFVVLVWSGGRGPNKGLWAISNLHTSNDLSIFLTRVLLLGAHGGELQWGLPAWKGLCLQVVH